MQCGQRRAAIADKIVEPARRFPAIAELGEREREIGNAFLIARLAVQFLETEPDERIPRSPQRQDANAVVDGGENLFGIFVEIPRGRGSCCHPRRGTVAASPELTRTT